MNDGKAARLERSCGEGAADWMRIAPSSPGLERIEGHFADHGYDPHRHDTYSIGVTVAGVQSFRYRGAALFSLPGQVYVLHPDETHDGNPGTSAGFRFRSLYVDPGMVAAALGERAGPLPFVRQAVLNDRRIVAALQPALDDLDRPLEELECDQLVAALAEALAAAEALRTPRSLSPPHRRAVMRARDLLDARLREGVSSSDLETATGLTRFALARHFRACLGTSPYRYLLLRRLDRVRTLIRGGGSLADAALASGFADQAHMTRHFKRAYGLTPGRWVAMATRAAR